jgi:ABC-type phosphate transport system auxiliary subunit
MPTTIPIEIYELLEKKIGSEEAKEVIKVITASLDAIEKKADALALQKKLEIRDELRKELATKEDLLLLKSDLEGEIKVIRQEIQTVRQELLKEIQTVRQELLKEIQAVKIGLDRKFTIMFVILFFTIIFLNQNALEFLARILGLIK